MRLGEDESVINMKRLYYELKTLGFSYSNFSGVNFKGNMLCPVGNINILDSINSKAIRFNNSGSALWNRSKQLIENNFTMVYSFNFHK
jgi:hypothetical protein